MLHAVGSHLNTLQVPRNNAEWAQVQRQASAAMETFNLSVRTSMGHGRCKPTFFYRDAPPWYHVVEGHRGLGFNGVAGGNQAGPEQVVAHVDVQGGKWLSAEVVNSQSLQGARGYVVSLCVRHE